MLCHSLGLHLQQVDHYACTSFVTSAGSWLVASCSTQRRLKACALCCPEAISRQVMNDEHNCLDEYLHQTTRHVRYSFESRC